jgi:hypothetical protein
LLRRLNEKRVHQVIQTFLTMENPTVRNVAQKLGLSKTTVHSDLTKWIWEVEVGNDVRDKIEFILGKNKKEAPIRGGLAVARKYKRKR